MKIAMVTEYLSPKDKPCFGGVDARTINLAKNLAKNNDVKIITSFVEDGERIENYDGVEIHRVGKKRKFTQRGSFLQRLKFNSEVISEISRLQPDVVDGSGFVSYAGCYKGAKKVGVPAVATVHEVWQGEWIQNMGLINGFVGHFLEKQYLKYNFNAYVSVSTFTKEKLIKKIGISKGKIEVIYNGIDLDLYETTKVDKKYVDPTIVTVCRLVSYKRVDDLIRTLKILKTDFPNIKLKIIGDGPQKDHLKVLSKNLGIEDDVDFLGKFRDFKDVIKVLKRSHVFALPSIAEGFGMVIVEAMASGIPYVASDIPPIREVTDGGVGGLLSKPKNCDDLALKIKTLLTDESKRIDLMKNVSKYLRNFEWSNLACKIEKCYDEIIRGYN